jgi:hypothetical protein
VHQRPARAPHGVRPRRSPRARAHRHPDCPRRRPGIRRARERARS